MNRVDVSNILNKVTEWKGVAIPENIKNGDMPGDKVVIEQAHIDKANTIFPKLIEELKEVFRVGDKAVIAVCGGSGVGKSETASLLSFYLESIGIGSYTLSGDNYPHRIPKYNDAERLRIFRKSGLKQMMKDGVYTPDRCAFVREKQEAEDDASLEYIKENDWYASYINGGIHGLKSYLGTLNEIDFHEIETIVSDFKAGKESIFLKRMGRSETELWYEAVDFSNTNVLIIEWTHGNSDYFEGVDIPVLLNSTPSETLAHRRARNRDGKTDSAFTMRVLEIEQEKLHNQAKKAKIIIAKNGSLLTFEEYSELMKGEF